MIFRDKKILWFTLRYFSISVLFFVCCFSILLLKQNSSLADVAETISQVYKERNFEDSGTILGVNNHISVKINRASDKTVAEAKAFAREIIRRPESVLDLTCFSKGFLPNFSNLGKIFSDLRFSPAALLIGNPLCQAIDLILDPGITGSLWGDLGLFFKMPGFNLPSFDFCGPRIQIASEVSQALMAALAFPPSGGEGARLKSGINTFGCLFSTNLQISGDFETPCFTVKIPSISCGSMSRLFNGAITSLLGGSDALNSMYNNGVIYASTTEKGKVAIGVSDQFNNSKYMQRTQRKTKEVEDFINKWADFGGSGLRYEGAATASGFAARSASADGITSDGGVNREAGNIASAGDGKEFMEQLTQNRELFGDILKDVDELRAGPRKTIGWRPAPIPFKGIDLKQVIKNMLEENNEDDAEVRK